MMKLNIEIEEQEFANGIPSIVQNLLNSLNEECKESKTKLVEIQSELQSVKSDKTTVESEKSKLAEELLQAKLEKEVFEKDLNDKLSKVNEDLANVQKEKSEIEEAKSKLAEEHSKVKDDLEKVEVEKDSLSEKLAKSEQECGFLRLELLEHDFSDLLKNLSEEEKSVVNNNFGNADDFKALLFSMDKIKVEDFYSEVRERVNNQKSEDIENLKKLAHITCEYYCAGTGCQMIEPKIGQEFSEQECIEKGSMKSFGKISKVLLFGIRSADGSVRNKAMVSIGK